MKNNDNKLLWQYAGFATQLIFALALSVFVGLKLDKWIALSFPLAVWVLPLLVIIALIIKAIKDTNTTKNK